MTNSKYVTMSKKELDRSKVITECISERYTIQEGGFLLQSATKGPNTFKTNFN